jgi:hypothetical protein
MAHWRFIKGRAVDLAIHFALQIGHFLRTLIDEQDDQLNVRMIDANRLRNLLEQNRFPDSGRGDDQSALTAPERRVDGNLWGREAAQLAKDIGARLVIPCHYEMFEFNTTTPAEFVETATSIGQPYRLLRAGERWSSLELGVTNGGSSGQYPE